MRIYICVCSDFIRMYCWLGVWLVCGMHFQRHFFLFTLHTAASICVSRSFSLLYWLWLLFILFASIICALIEQICVMFCYVCGSFLQATLLFIFFFSPQHIKSIYIYFSKWNVFNVKLRLAYGSKRVREGKEVSNLKRIHLFVHFS